MNSGKRSKRCVRLPLITRAHTPQTLQQAHAFIHQMHSGLITAARACADIKTGSRERQMQADCKDRRLKLSIVVAATQCATVY